MSDRGGASHGCDTGWIRAAAARPCCCSARLCNPPAQRFALLCAHNLLCCTLQQQAVLVCAHPAWETRRRLAGKFGASRGRAPPSPWSKSLLLPLHCSAARSAAAHTTLPRWSKRCGGGRARRDLCQGHGAAHCTANTSPHKNALCTVACARAPPIPLGKDLPLLSTRWSGEPLPHLSVRFHKYFSDEFHISTENITKELKGEANIC